MEITAVLFLQYFIRKCKMKILMSISGLAETDQRGIGWPAWHAWLTLICIGVLILNAPNSAVSQEARDDSPEWKILFDGKSLGKWEPTSFGGEGEVQIEEGAIILGAGVSLTGVHWTGEVPKVNYEIQLEAQQLQGIDFFCGLTFPVHESHCSLIVGGWAGSVVGLSNIDGLDASQNETTKYMKFEKDKWYRIRVRVEPDRIRGWIDDEIVVDQNIKDRKINLRAEVIPSKPLGIAAWQTKAGLRKIQIRELPQ